MSFLLKDPEAVLDYAVDWGTDYLSGDALLDSSWRTACRRCRPDGRHDRRFRSPDGDHRHPGPAEATRADRKLAAAGAPG